MKKVMIVLAIGALLLSVAGPAQAALTTYLVTINYAGVNSQNVDVIYIHANSETGAWSGGRWFIATGSEAKACLATALSAWSMGGAAILLLESTDIDEWSPIYGVFAGPPP